MKWFFLNTGFSSGSRNMAFDVSLAERCIRCSGESYVRVYGWRPEAISLGWNQSWNEIDARKTEEAGIGLVRRPTGGRAILHSEEITYCVIMSVKDQNIPAVYSRISMALIQALEHLGVRASLERSQPHFPSLYRKAESTACFVSSARSEIMVGGRKLVGSAQRRYAAPENREVVLQHGSILLGPSHKQLARFLNVSGEQQQYLTNQLNEKTTDLKEILGRAVTFEEAAKAVRSGFESAWDLRFESHEPSVEEERVHEEHED